MKRSMMMLAVAVLLLCTRAGLAQDYPKRAHDFNYFQPFGPMEVEEYHDMQPFAPPDVSMFDNGPQANTGFFFKYDRMNVNVGRPERAYANWDGDWTWGNRYAFGYMTNEQHGWLAEIIHVTGPTYSDTDFNDFRINEGSFQSYEFNKTWRSDQLHYLGYIEPFIGVRYNNMKQRDLFMWTENDIYGGQIGVRAFKQRERWLLSTEGRLFGGYNQQTYMPQDGTMAFSGGDFVMLGDVRVEATYILSKAFALSVGWELLFIPDNTARASLPGGQDYYMTGVTFGFQVNR